MNLLEQYGALVGAGGIRSHCAGDDRHRGELTPSLNGRERVNACRLDADGNTRPAAARLGDELTGVHDRDGLAVDGGTRLRLRTDPPGCLREADRAQRRRGRSRQVARIGGNPHLRHPGNRRHLRE